MDPQPMIELRFSATGLANKDVLSLSDPFLVVHTYVDGTPRRLVARTEVVVDDLHPVWVGTLTVPATLLGRGAMFVVHAFDEDAPDVGMDVLHTHDFLGMALFGLDDVMMRSTRTSTTSAQGNGQRKSARNMSRNWTGTEFGGSRLDGENEGATLTIPFSQSEALLYCQRIQGDVIANGLMSTGAVPLLTYATEAEGKFSRKSSKESTTTTVSDIGGQEEKEEGISPQAKNMNIAHEKNRNRNVDDKQIGKRNSRAFSIDKTEPENDVKNDGNGPRVSVQRQTDAVDERKGHAFHDSIDSAVTDVDCDITREVLNDGMMKHVEMFKANSTRASTTTTTTTTTRTRETVSTTNWNSTSSMNKSKAIPNTQSPLTSPQSTNTTIADSSNGFFHKHSKSSQHHPQQQQQEKIPSSKFLPLSTSAMAVPVAVVPPKGTNNNEFTFSAADASSLRRATTSRRAVSGLRGNLTVGGEFLSATRGRRILLDVHSAVVKARTTTSFSSSSSLSLSSSSTSSSGCGVGVVGSAAAAAAVNTVGVVRQFYEVRRRSASGGSSGDNTSWDVVYRSEDGGVIVNGSHIRFKRAVLYERELHNGSPDRRIRIVALRRRLKHKHDVIAWVDTTWGDLVDHDNGRYGSHQRQWNRSCNSDGLRRTDEIGSSAGTHFQQQEKQLRDDIKPSNLSDPVEHILQSSSTVTTAHEVYSTSQNHHQTETRFNATPKRQKTKTIPLQTEFHDLDDSGVGNATVRTCMVSPTVGEEDTEVVRIVAELNHFVGLRYKAVLPKTTGLFSSVGTGRRMSSSMGICGLAKGVGQAKTYADEDDNDYDRMGTRMTRRKTISSIPKFITRH